MTDLDKLKDAFAQALGASPDSDFDNFAYAKTPGWDSVAHMNLIAAIESTFDLMLATEDVIAMSSFQKAREIVTRYGVSVA